MFAPLKRAARAIFKDEIRIRRDGRGIRLALEASPALQAAAGGVAQPSAEQRRRAELQRMAEDLARVFAAQPDSRQQLRQLAYFEQQLPSAGLALLDVVPLAVLRQALQQLEDTVINWAPEGLACLRSKMAVALQQRARRGEDEDDMGDNSLPEVVDVELPAVDGELDAEEAALLAVYGAMAAPVTAGTHSPPPDEAARLAGYARGLAAPVQASAN